MIEIWRDVMGFETYYQVSNLGNVKSLDRFVYAYPGAKGKLRRGRIKSVGYTPNGYTKFGFYKEGESKTISGHRLVAIAFIPNPFNLPHVNHLNGVKTDNRVENLEWCTCSENIKHAYKTGLSRQDGENHATRKLNWIKVREIRRLHSSGQKDKYELSEMFEIHPGHVNNIIANLYWKEKHGDN